VCRTWCFDEFRLFDARLVDFKRSPSYRQRTEGVVRSGSRCVQPPKSTGPPSDIVTIHRENTSATQRTAPEHHYRSGVARIFEHGLNRQSLSKTAFIRRVTRLAVFRHNTIESGEVGPVVFDHLPTWWLIARGAVSARLPGVWIFDEFRLFDVQLVDFKRLQALTVDLKRPKSNGPPSDATLGQSLTRYPSRMHFHQLSSFGKCRPMYVNSVLCRLFRSHVTERFKYICVHSAFLSTTRET